MASTNDSPRLIVESGRLRGKSVALTREQACRIGNAADCELRIEEPGVADHHLVVKALVDSGFGARSLDHEFRLNNRTTEAARLTDGDVLEIGDTQVRFAVGASDHANGDQKTIGGFRLLRVVGVGGMGTVHEAEQVSLHREVALKILHKKLTRDPVFVARFVAEARAAARLHHPNVVQVFDVGHDGDTFFYSMEMMHGGSLETRLKEVGKLDVQETLSVIADAARGLSFAESLRIVHRDIKPDNLMLDRHGNVKIADLGLAMTDEDDISKVIGTPHFMSPEQVLKQPLDHRSDLYSLGCTFYRLLTGRTPFRRDTVKGILRAHVKELPEPANRVDPEVPPEVAAIVGRLLQKDPDDRYQSADELLEDIEAVLMPPARKGLVISGIALAVMIAGAGLAWGLTRPEGKTERITIKEKDPRVAGLLEDIRQKDAELARYRVLLSGVTGLAGAEALERIAEEHPDTAAAEQSMRDAADLRAEYRRAEATRRAREAEVASAADELREATAAAIEAGDYHRAVSLLAAGDVPTELRDEAVLRDTRADLSRQLRRHAEKALAALRSAVAAGRAQRDPEALATALTALEAAIEPDTGWPREALTTREDAARFAADSRRFLGELRSTLAAEADARAWTRYRDAMLGDGGVLNAVDALDFDRATARGEELAAAVDGLAAGEHAAHLAVSLQHAGAYLERFIRAAGSESLTYSPRTIEVEGSRTPDLPVVSFTPRGKDAGLVVKVGPVIRPKPRLVRLERLRDAELDAAFPPLAEAPDLDRAAFIGWVALADHLYRSRDYLTKVSSQDPRSGTGEQAYGGDPAGLIAASEALRQSEEPWARALDEEIAAAQLMVRALRAFSSQRNLSAANYIERLQQTFAHSIVVSGLSP